MDTVSGVSKTINKTNANTDNAERVSQDTYLSLFKHTTARQTRNGSV